MSEAAQRKGKPKVENRKTDARQRQKIARYLPSLSSRCDVQRNYWNARRKLEVPMPAAMLWQDQGEKVQGQLSHSWSSRILTTRKRSVWRNREFIKKIGSFAEDRSLTWSTTISGLLALMIPFLITLNFSMILRSDDIHEFDTRWDEFILSMTKIPHDDVLESLFKLRIRESDQFINRIRVVWNGKIIRKDKKNENDGEEKHSSETQKRNFDSTIERMKTGAVVTNRRSQRGVERCQGECYQWNAKGQWSRGYISSTMVIRVQNRHENRSIFWTTNTKT